jgi:hypothetical protein
MKKVYVQPEVVKYNFAADVVVMSGILGNDDVLIGDDMKWY